LRIEQTSLPEVLVIEPHVYSDERGFFLEAFKETRFAEHGLPTVFRQDNHSRSMKGVLRGLHYQVRQPQGKLITVITGCVFDVAVDVRVGSATFGKWCGVTLSGEQPRYLWIPPGFAHGLCVLSDVADVTYKCTEMYAPNDEAGIRWDDPALGIVWPIDAPQLSPRDQQWPPLSTTRSRLPTAVG
jgi:dTDP-4-dehydrorhamnose 3,5-epimerase